VITVKRRKERSLTCSEFLLFTSVFSIHLEESFLDGHSTFNMTMTNLTEAERWDIENKGLRVFRFEVSMKDAAESLLATAHMFEPLITKHPTRKASEANIKFLKNYVGVDMLPRSIPTVDADKYASSIYSGDFIGVIRLDGLDTMLAWAMGSHTGHTTIAMRDENDELYVLESQTKSNYWPTDFVQKTPFKKWLKQAEEAGYNVVHAPLREEMRSAFDANAAMDWFRKSAEGFLYGYYNMLMGWLDTENGNWPLLPPDYKRQLEPTLVETLFPFVVKKAPGAGIVFVQTMNKRVNATGLDLASVWKKAKTDMNLSFTELITIVEDDSWHYNTTRNGKVVDNGGPAWVCCVFVCEIYKQSGLFRNKFGVEDDEINCAEFTNLDVYGLNIFNETLPESCDQPGRNLCQLTGDYEMHLPVNQFELTKHFAEKCPSQGPNYTRPLGC